MLPDMEYKCLPMEEYHQLLVSSATLVAVYEHFDLENLVSRDDQVQLADKVMKLLEEWA